VDEYSSNSERVWPTLTAGRTDRGIFVAKANGYRSSTWGRHSCTSCSSSRDDPGSRAEYDKTACSEERTE